MWYGGTHLPVAYPTLRSEGWALMLELVKLYDTHVRIRCTEEARQQV